MQMAANKSFYDGKLYNSDLFLSSIREDEDGASMSHHFTWIIEKFQLLSSQTSYICHALYVDKNRHQLCFHKRDKVGFSLIPNIQNPITLKVIINKKETGQYWDAYWIDIAYNEINLEIDFTITVQKQEDGSFPEITSPFTELKSYLRMFKQMDELFVSGKYTDFKVVVGDKEFNVHRSILSSRSSVFASMLEVDMKEKMENKIVINDCDSESFNQFLRYIYTGRSKIISVNLAHNFYKIADKYDFRELKSESTSYLVNKLDISNVIETYELATLYNDSVLQEASLKYCADYFSKIMELPDWESLRSNEAFMNSLLPLVAQRVSPKNQ